MSRNFVSTSFSHTLRNLRIERGLTPEELAVKLGTSVSLINQYESGRRSPTGKRQEELANFFDVDVDYLMGRSSIRKVDRYIDTTSGITDEEAELVARLRKLPPELSRAIAGFIHQLTD